MKTSKTSKTSNASVSVWGLKDAFLDAYELGLAAARKGASTMAERDEVIDAIAEHVLIIGELARCPVIGEGGVKDALIAAYERGRVSASCWA